LFCCGSAGLGIALSLIVFFTFTYPANQQTVNWTVLPDNGGSFAAIGNTRRRCPCSLDANRYSICRAMVSALF
jgi:hypothetical protein